MAVNLRLGFGILAKAFGAATLSDSSDWAEEEGAPGWMQLNLWDDYALMDAGWVGGKILDG